MISVYVNAPSTHFRLHYLGSQIYRRTYRWFLGIFRQSNIFIDKNVLFPCQHKIREYYPILEKQNRYFSYLMMKIATTFTVRLVYRHGWFSSWSMLTCTCYFFLSQNATIAMVFDDASSLFIYLCVQVL